MLRAIFSSGRTSSRLKKVSTAHSPRFEHRLGHLGHALDGKHAVEREGIDQLRLVTQPSPGEVFFQQEGELEGSHRALVGQTAHTYHDGAAAKSSSAA